MKFPVTGNPDFWQGDYNVFKIADSRKINEAHLNKPVKYDRKIFVISANFITKDAQNSLLKIFEEPNPGTHFFVIMPQNILLSTLRSRMQIVNLQNFATAAGEQWSHDQNAVAEPEKDKVEISEEK